LAMGAYKNALYLMPPHTYGWVPEVSTCSSTEGTGIESVWDTIKEYYSKVGESNLKQIRKNQNAEWLNETLQNRLLEDFLVLPKVLEQLPKLKKQVIEGEIIPSFATQQLIKLVLSGTNEQ